MISIISTNNSNNVHHIESRLAERGIDKTTIVSAANNLHTYINTAIVFSNIVVCIGNTFHLKQAISKTIVTPLVYDKSTQSHIVNYCKKASRQLPPQHILDNLCSVPEGFVSMANHSSEQCACYGQFKKTTIFILPDNITDIAFIYKHYIVKVVDKLYPAVNSRIYKTFGLTYDDINTKLNNAVNNRLVSHYCETTPDLVGTIVINPISKLSNMQTTAIDKSVVACLGSNLYSTSNKSLAQELVDLLLDLQKTVAIAESITGGLLASAIVDIPGASKVLLESAVTYTLTAKHRRLGINPHMIDTAGVVSSQVATSMVDNVKQQSGADFALSTTGYAGPTAVDGMPIGLCYIGVATHNNSRAYKLQFSGDRHNIRMQAVNSALLLLINNIKNVTIV